MRSNGYAVADRAGFLVGFRVIGNVVDAGRIEIGRRS